MSPLLKCFNFVSGTCAYDLDGKEKYNNLIELKNLNNTHYKNY